MTNNHQDRARQLIGHYINLTDNTQEPNSKKQIRVLMQYNEAINGETFPDDGNSPLNTTDTYASLRPLFQEFFASWLFQPQWNECFNKVD
jgi:hypothetical protein